MRLAIVAPFLPAAEARFALLFFAADFFDDAFFDDAFFDDFLADLPPIDFFAFLAIRVSPSSVVDAYVRACVRIPSYQTLAGHREKLSKI
jgi:hypothetical protein